MKKQSSSKSGFINTRNLLGVFLCLASVSLTMLTFASAVPSKQTIAGKQPTARVKPAGSQAPAAPSPASATLSTSNRSITYTDSTGSLPNPSAVGLGAPVCTVPMSCSTFTLTIDSSVGTAAPGYDPTKFRIFIDESWNLSVNDYDTFVEDSGGNVIGQNLSTADPETITLSTSLAPGTYSVILVMATGAPVPYTGTITLQPIPMTSGNCLPANSAACAPPRYQNYPAGAGQSDNAGEPSLGVDWNPNVASLQVHNATQNLNHGGVAFFTSGANEWRVNFDDCPSPAINKWEDVSSTFTQQFVLSDPIGFVDHYSSSQLGLVYPPPHTTGRVFTIDLLGGQGDSAGSFSDNDGNSYTPGGNGGPGQGPDHETLGGGPYNLNSTPAPPPQTVAYGSPNAIYYCSQNIAGDAECSRSDNGGQTFGPGIPIFQNPAQCAGGIHGHVKVAPDGTVYVPNSSCGAANGGLDGMAVSQDNGITWTENNVPLSTGSQDPSVGIGQNNVGKVGSTNTIYLGWISGDGHPHVADSHDRGVTWEHDTDIGALITVPVTHGVFPVVVAGDDNRAAFGFLGTGDGIATSGTCDPYGATLNCANIWHLYVATTYDGGATWIPVDATPNDPVQQGTICLQGTTCAGGRNLLDFNDFAIDSEGRGLVGYADGCVNCNNTFQGQSSANHGTVARQSGGRRLFAAFDPNEPMPPAAPQMVSAVTQTGSGVLVTWIEPDNGGSPITGYNVYRGTTSGSETFLAHVSGETTTKYLDPAPPTGNVFYYAQAINAIGEGDHCGEVTTGVIINMGNACTLPYLPVDPAGSAGTVSTDPTMGEMTIQYVDIGEPFTNCADNSITFLMKVKTMDPGGTGMAVPPPNGEWQILFNITDTNGNPETVFVDMDTNGITPTPEFSYGRRDPSTTGGTLDTTECTAGTTSTCPGISGSVGKDGTIIIKLNVSTPITFAAPTAGSTSTTPFTWDASKAGTKLTSVTGDTVLLVGAAGTGFLETVQTTGGGSYTRIGNGACNPTTPIASLTGSPVTGNAPLSVNFNGSASSELTGACGTINSYTMNFGDGSAPVTQTCGTICPGSAASFSHTYTVPGDYTAKLTVSDTVSHTSTNVAQVFITVSGIPPQLSAVSSRLIHGSGSTFFDVNLPLSGPRGVECRSSGSLGAGNYTMIFTFANNLVSVDGATIASGTASVSSTALGPNANQYTLNLTSVSNQQYVSVALVNAKDSTGAIGDVVGPQMGVLIGDTNADGFVNSADIGQTKSQSGQSVISSNFREDLNADGFHNSADIGLTKSKSGTALPSTP
jgi:hypothetical protein